jgi:hypothetical protein
MPRKRFSAEQIVVLLRQIEVSFVGNLLGKTSPYEEIPLGNNLI